MIDIGNFKTSRSLIFQDSENKYNRKFCQYAMTQNYYDAPNDLGNQMLNQLGIDIKFVNSSIDPSSQPKQIGMQYHKKNTNKYQQKQDDEDKQDDDNEIPSNLMAVSTRPQKSSSSMKQQQQKGRKKQTKNFKKKKPAQKENVKQQISPEIDLDEVAEWGEKGTKPNNYDDDDDFNDEEQQQEQNTAEQEQIRKRIQEKLKKYQNPSQSNKPKNTLGSLQNKAQQLKKIKEEKKQPIMEQSSHQFLKEKPVKHEQKIDEKSDQQQSDHWENINKKTLADKKTQNDEMKKAQEMNINKYYENLTLPDLQDELEEEAQPSTGFFQNLCKCLSTKKKSITQLQKQILKISKIQLSNKPEQIVLLKSIWTLLTNKKYLRYGEHWSEIGFQGRDPATDLRSTGILSLVHWENFLKFDLEYCQKISNFCTQFDIPMALSHIKITSLLCSCLKKRLLEGKSWQDFLQWYYALSYYTFDHLIKNAKSLDQAGELIEKSIARTKSQLQNAKKYFNKQIKEKR